MTDLSYRSAPATFSVGGSLSQAFRVFMSGAGRFMVLAAVPAIPALLAGLTADPVPGFSATQLGAGLLQFFLAFVVQGATVYGAFQEMRGQSFRIGDSVAKGLERLLPLIGVSLLASIGVMLGTMLLIIPGVILAMMWAVSIPACVVERRGVLDSLRRSAALTAGHRWKLLAMILVLLVIALVAMLVLAPIMIAIGGGGFVLLLNFALSAALGAFGSVLVAVIYYQMRAGKEGVSLDQIISVFD